MSLNFLRPSLRGVSAQAERTKQSPRPMVQVASPNWRSRKHGNHIDYGNDVEIEISRVEAAITASDLSLQVSPRWLAIKLLEGDADAKQLVNAELATEAQLAATRLADKFAEDADILIADRRYTWINSLVKRTVTRSSEQSISLSDRVDQIVTNKWLGIPIFLFAMWATLKITADVSAPYLDWVDFVIKGPVTNWALALLSVFGLGGTWLESLIVDGVIAGVGGVLVFVPVLMALYFVLGLLEDSGYMARAAFVMDWLMNALGLHGKSFLPMLIGFGCSVPAFYATRTLENQRDRILTALLVPFMSCSARLPVYLLFAAVFFSSMSGSIVFGMYLLGIVVAILVGLTLKRTAFKGKQESAFVMELPPYRLPSLRSIWFHVREHTAGFLRKCSSIIVLMSILLWFATAIPVGGTGSFARTDIEHSLFAHAANAAVPVFRPLGFGSWEAAGALFTGFVAKEVVVSTMAQIYDAAPSEAQTVRTGFVQDLADIGTGFVNASVDTLKSLPLIIGIDLRGQSAQPEQTGLMTAIRGGFEGISGGHGALAALAFMIFVLVYTPCMAAVSAEKQEFGSRVMWASIIGQSVLAWLLALIVFQGGLLLGIG